MRICRHFQINLNICFRHVPVDILYMLGLKMGLLLVPDQVDADPDHVDADPGFNLSPSYYFFLLLRKSKYRVKKSIFLL